MAILRKETTIHVIFATLFLIPFQTVLLFPISLDSLMLIQDKPMNLFQENPYLFLGYFLLPIIYCIYLSIVFSPKRLISPLHIQIGSFVVFSILVIDAYISVETMTIETIQNLLANLFFIAMYIILIGFIQFFIVWWVIGLNYSDSERRTFLINRSPKELKKILGKDFLMSRDFNRPRNIFEKQNEPITILKYTDASKNNVIIGIGQYKNDKDKSVLSTVAYHKDISWISKTDAVIQINNSIINDIKERLIQIDKKITLEELKKVNDLVSINAYAFIEHDTQTKIELIVNFFRKLSPFFRNAIYFTIFALISIVFAVCIGFINVDTFTGILIPTLIALIIEIGIPLKNEFSLKKVDDFDK